MNDEGKSLFFLILSLSCIWLIMDMYYGNKYLSKLIDGIFGEYTESSTSGSTSTDDKTIAKNSGNTTHTTSSTITKNNSTNSGATSNKNFPYQTGDEQRKDAQKSDATKNNTGSAGNTGTSFNPYAGNLGNSNTGTNGNNTGGNSPNFPY